MRDEYWEERQNLSYYKEVKRLLEDLGPMHNILDIGSGGTPVATWGDFTHRYAMDKDPCKQYEGVSQCQCSWQDYPIGEKSWDVITCLQVMEHLPNYENAIQFGRKIVRNCKYAILSVPLNWPADACQHHPLDPITFEDLPIFDRGTEWLSYKLCSDKGVQRAVWMVKGFIK